MNSAQLAIAATAVLVGCATQHPTRWTKAGATSQAFEADKARCTVYAHRAVPAYQPPQNPPTKYKSDCVGDRYSWNCETRATDGGYRSPIDGLMQGQDMARVDNARGAAFSGCMYDRGWTLQRAR
jgi:hypothetical protein